MIPLLIIWAHSLLYPWQKDKKISKRYSLRDTRDCGEILSSQIFSQSFTLIKISYITFVSELKLYLQSTILYFSQNFPYFMLKWTCGACCCLSGELRDLTRFLGIFVWYEDYAAYFYAKSPSCFFVTLKW